MGSESIPLAQLPQPRRGPWAAKPPCGKNAGRGFVQAVHICPSDTLSEHIFFKNFNISLFSNMLFMDLEKGDFGHGLYLYSDSVTGPTRGIQVDA